MKDGAAEGGFHALALRESRCAPVRNRSKPKNRNYRFYPLMQRLGRHTAKPAVVEQVFPYRQPRIDSGMVEQGPQAALPGERIAGRGDIIDHNGACIRLEYTANHPKCGCLACAVGAKQTCDRSIWHIEG